MPKTEIDYSNTIIYKITCKDETCKELYVGHTTNFVQRKHSHKQSCINSKSEYHNLKLYKVIRENGGWDNWNMEIVYFCNCANSYEARKKEQEFYESLNATLNTVQPYPNSNLVEKDKPKPMYYCELCKIYTTSLKLLEKHNEKTHSALSQTETTSNKMTNDDKHEPSQRFYCSICEFKCYNKNDYRRHLGTKKHSLWLEKSNEATNSNVKCLFTQNPDLNNVEKTDSKNECSICKKTFNSRSGIWRHNKKHHSSKEKSTDNVGSCDADFDLKTMFMDLMKQNEEFKKIMLEQNTKMLELANNQSITNNGTINNNTMNNKFNLNFFLNETCKDAMNIQEFIDYVKVQHSDFENFGKYGYVESMTRIIMRNLMELEVHRRPIHCTDAKREVLYVKDNNVWVNDFSREKLIRAIKYIAAKNVKQIPDWMDHNPDSKNTQTKLHDKYMRMVCYSMGGRDEAEDQEYYKKIIHNVAKEVVIDKMK